MNENYDNKIDGDLQDMAEAIAVANIEHQIPEVTLLVNSKFTRIHLHKVFEPRGIEFPAAPEVIDKVIAGLQAVKQTVLDLQKLHSEAKA